MYIRIMLRWIGLTVIIASLGAAPASPPTSNAELPELTPRQQNLLLQLSDAEANIQAINKALIKTGYKVGLAYDRIDSNLMGNDLMNRKGGGPVRWDAFYGSTAKDYASNGPISADGRVVHNWGDRRPKQFSFIYKANNNQVARAREQISTLAQDQAALLARRQKHETDQCRLWATLAWEQVKDREIQLRSLYRFALKPRGAQAAVLQPLILFLRTADRVAVEGLESVQENPTGAFQAAAKRMEAAFAALQISLADTLEAPGLTAEQRKAGETLKGLCKNLAGECKIIADNHANALDRDKAKQDTSKLEFLGQLQASLASFAATVGQLDEEIAGVASTWGVEPDKGMPAADAMPAGPAAAKTAATDASAKLPEIQQIDPLRPGTIWAGDKRKLTILDRQGDNVRARFTSAAKTVHIVTGSVKDGKFTWTAKGDVDGVQIGTIKGNLLDVEFTDIGKSKKSGTYILRLTNPLPAAPQ